MKKEAQILFLQCAVCISIVTLSFFKLIKTFDLKCVNKIKDTMETHINTSHKRVSWKTNRLEKKESSRIWKEIKRAESKK